MNKLLTIFLLLIHINTSMFIPVMDEVDIFDLHGMQIGDINTAYEFIDQVVLGHQKESSQDEDDDQAHYFNVTHMKAFVVPRFELSPAKALASPIVWVDKPSYTIPAASKWVSVTYDITVPPPKA